MPQADVRPPHGPQVEMSGMSRGGHQPAQPAPVAPAGALRPLPRALLERAARPAPVQLRAAPTSLPVLCVIC